MQGCVPPPPLHILATPRFVALPGKLMKWLEEYHPTTVDLAASGIRMSPLKVLTATCYPLDDAYRRLRRHGVELLRLAVAEVATPPKVTWERGRPVVEGLAVVRVLTGP